MKCNILLIEDNAEVAGNISSILGLENYKVMHAVNGMDGVKLAQQKLPDLILCDITRPEFDGYGVLHVLNKDPETASIPFVFITDGNDKNELRAAMNLGADDYLIKPFDGDDLLKVIEARLRKSKLLKTSLMNSGRNHPGTEYTTDLKRLAEGRPVRSFRRKSQVFMQGQSANDLYFIKKGQVKTYKTDYEGKELITGIYHEGDFLGFTALLEDKPYNENAEVLETAEIAIIPKVDFLTLMYSNKDITRSFIRTLSNNIDEIENRLLDIAYHSVRQRVASTLLKIDAQLTGQRDGGVITVSRKDLANIVGTATESLNRTLADLREEGLITILPHGLRIVNRLKLQKLSH